MIYVVSIYYPPVSNPPASRMGQLVRWLVATYGADNVRVVTGRPNYPDGVLPREFRWRLCRRQTGAHGEAIDHIYELPAPFRGLYRKTLGFVTFAASVLAYFLFRRLKNDLVLVTSGPVFSTYSIYLLTLLKGRFRYIVDVRDLWPQVVAGMGFLNEDSRGYRLLACLSDLAYRRAAALVGNSPGICSYLESVAPDLDTVFIPNPVDTDMFRPLSAESRRSFRAQNPEIFDPTGGLHLLFSGTFSNYLGIMTLMESAARLSRTGLPFRFILIGQGEEERQIREFVSANKLEGHIIMLPFMDRRELVRYINAADVCFASLKDTETLRYAIPTKVLEYLACNKKVVTSLAGPFGDMLEEEQAALVCPPGDATRLAAVLRAAARTKAQSVSVTEPRAFVEANFSVGRFETGFRQLLHGLLAE